MKTLWISAAAGAVIGLGFVAAASAQAAPQKQSKATPSNWNWTLDSKGNRVAKGKVVRNPDGSERRELRGAKCVTVIEKSATEYRQKSDCNPG